MLQKDDLDRLIRGVVEVSDSYRCDAKQAWITRALEVYNVTYETLMSGVAIDAVAPAQELQAKLEELHKKIRGIQVSMEPIKPLTAKDLRDLIDRVQFTANDTGVGVGEQSRWVLRALAVVDEVSKAAQAGTSKQKQATLDTLWARVSSLVTQINKTQEWINAQQGNGNVVELKIAPVPQSGTVHVGGSAYFADRHGEGWDISTEDGDALCSIPFPCSTEHLATAISWYLTARKEGVEQGKQSAREQMRRAIGVE